MEIQLVVEVARGTSGTVHHQQAGVGGDHDAHLVADRQAVAADEAFSRTKIRSVHAAAAQVGGIRA